MEQRVWSIMAMFEIDVGSCHDHFNRWEIVGRARLLQWSFHVQGCQVRCHFSSWKSSFHNGSQAILSVDFLTVTMADTHRDMDPAMAANLLSMPSSIMRRSSWSM